MLLFHLRTLQRQLEQAYVGMALAAAAGRAFILPQVQCPRRLLRATPASAMQLPTPCRRRARLTAIRPPACPPSPPGSSLQFQCFCQNADQPLPRCRRPDSAKLQFPAACPEGDILMPLPDFASGGEVQGLPLRVEPHALAQRIEAVSHWVREAG